jgi:hypothetical protein
VTPACSSSRGVENSFAGVGRSRPANNPICGCPLKVAPQLTFCHRFAPSFHYRGGTERRYLTLGCKQLTLEWQNSPRESTMCTRARVRTAPASFLRKSVTRDENRASCRALARGTQKRIIRPLLRPTPDRTLGTEWRNLWSVQSQYPVYTTWSGESKPGIHSAVMSELVLCISSSGIPAGTCCR